jgi:hypothetical protein
MCIPFRCKLTHLIKIKKRRKTIFIAYSECFAIHKKNMGIRNGMACTLFARWKIGAIQSSGNKSCCGGGEGESTSNGSIKIESIKGSEPLKKIFK